MTIFAINNSSYNRYNHFYSNMASKIRFLLVLYFYSSASFHVIIFHCITESLQRQFFHWLWTNVSIPSFIGQSAYGLFTARTSCIYDILISSKMQWMFKRRIKIELFHYSVLIRCTSTCYISCSDALPI